MELFEDGDTGYPDGDDDDEATMGKTTRFVLGLDGNPAHAHMDFANLHPDDWFTAFKSERFNDHA